MRRKPRVFWLCIVVVLAILVLASSLHDVQFEPGLSIAQAAALKVPNALPAIRAIADTPLWRIVLYWLGGVAYLVLFLLLLPAYLRKRILRQLFGFVVGVLGLLVVIHYRLLELPAFLSDGSALAGSGGADSVNGLPIPDFRAPAASGWFGYVVAVLVLWALALLIWYVYRRWPGGMQRVSVSLSQIEGIARTSLDELASGRNWADVVIEAYARMSEAVGVRRGLRRHHAATPREFADHLTRAGLPADAVGGLTRLFESVRYGGVTSSESDVKQAVTYLESILQACEASA